MLVGWWGSPVGQDGDEWQYKSQQSHHSSSGGNNWQRRQRWRQGRRQWHVLYMRQMYNRQRVCQGSGSS